MKIIRVNKDNMEYAKELSKNNIIVEGENNE